VKRAHLNGTSLAAERNFDGAECHTCAVPSAAYAVYLTVNDDGSTALISDGIDSHTTNVYRCSVNHPNSTGTSASVLINNGFETALLGVPTMVPLHMWELIMNEGWDDRTRLTLDTAIPRHGAPLWETAAAKRSHRSALNVFAQAVIE
jgi:hypothetical protein